MKVLIVDDEPLARTRIKNLLDEHRRVDTVLEYGDVNSAINGINEHKPDLLFLDIQMKSRTGFEVLDMIDEVPMTIFVTAYDKYALKAFDYFAFDYLLKPFKDDRFHTSMNRALKYLESQQANDFTKDIRSLLDMIRLNQVPEGMNSQVVKESLSIKLGDRTYFIKTKEIEYIQASGYYAEIKHNGQMHILRDSLSNLVGLLDPRSFIRIHRSSIINKEFVKELVSIGFGDVEVKMTDNQVLRVSKSYKEALVNFLDS